MFKNKHFINNSKQWVINAVTHQPNKTIPLDFWSTPQTDEKLLQYFGFDKRRELLDKFNIDIEYIDGPIYTGRELKQYSDGSSEDIWGVRRKTCYVGEGDKQQSYKAVVNSPLKEMNSVDEILAYQHWPDPNDFDYTGIKQQCEQASPRAVFFMGDRLNRIAQLKPAMYLRGMEQVMVDVAINSDILKAIIEKTVAFYCEYLKRILTAAMGMIDVVVTGDDFGAQGGLLISPRMWRDYLGPGFKRFLDICHEFSVPVMHHTCGGIYELIPDMIEMGLDVLNPLQPNTFKMDFTKIKAEFGDRLCFHGGISIQTNLPFGTAADVKQEVKEAFETLGKQTGYIACTAHNIQADTPVENIIALIEAYEEYRTKVDI